MESSSSEKDLRAILGTSSKENQEHTGLCWEMHHQHIERGEPLLSMAEILLG